MRTRLTRKSPWVLAAIGGALLVASAGGPAQGQSIASDEPAGYLVFPKVEVDPDGVFHGGTAVDTIIQISNAQDGPADGGATVALHCFWINANSRCSNSGAICDPTSDNSDLNCRGIGGRCQADWRVTDFRFELTPAQPIGFPASTLGFTPECADALSADPNCVQVGTGGGSILGVPEFPFIGELKCVQVDNLTDVEPVGANDLIGSARIYAVSTGGVDVRQYNAIGVQADETADFNAGPANQMCLGTLADDPSVFCPEAEYASCPATLVVNHFFEGVAPFDDGDDVSTQLTLVPCTENIENVSNTSSLTGQISTTAQLAVYNEFEQRFSSSTRVECFRSIALADLDTPVGPTGDSSSVFSASVQGTLTGQTRVRGVPSDAQFHGLLAITEEIYSSGFSSAANVNYEGVRPGGAGDLVSLP